MDKARIRISMLPEVGYKEVKVYVHPNYAQTLHIYGTLHKKTLHAQVMELQDWDSYQEMVNLYFLLVDKLTREECGGFLPTTDKKRVRKQTEEEYGARDSNGKLKSLSPKTKTPYSKTELWHLIQGITVRIEEWGASMHEVRGLMADLKEEK